MALQHSTKIFEQAKWITLSSLTACKAQEDSHSSKANLLLCIDSLASGIETLVWELSFWQAKLAYLKRPVCPWTMLSMTLAASLCSFVWLTSCVSWMVELRVIFQLVSPAMPMLEVVSLTILLPQQVYAKELIILRLGTLYLLLIISCHFDTWFTFSVILTPVIFFFSGSEAQVWPL